MSELRSVTTDARLDNEGLWSDAKTAMTLSSGDRIDPLHPSVEDIHISDIAHSLSMQCRYNGHTGGHYSVARHSLIVSQLLYEDPWAIDADWPSPKNGMEDIALLALTGLLHDAAEAYLGDMIRPLKHGPETGRAYLEAEKKLEAVIFKRFGIKWPLAPIIGKADTYVLLEKELSGVQLRWTWDSTWRTDEDEFLERYRELVQEVRSNA